MPEIDLPEEASDESRRDHPEPPPRAVLEGVVRRDPQALGTFFDYAFPIVYGLAARLMGSTADAEDITQDVFVKAHRAAERLDPGRDPRPWLTTITYNACRDHWRRPAVSRTSSLDEAEHVSATLRDEGDAPDVALERAQSEVAVQRAIVELDEPLKEVVVLHDYQGCSHDEIATMVGASHAAVRKRYSRALARLRELLKDTVS
jgi:RNA polymerase sigma-70 factor (ECF subfamily)